MSWTVTPVSGALDRRNASPAEAEALDFGDARTVDLVSIGYSPYYDRAIQGATIAPRPFWFVVPDSEARGERLRVKTDPQQRDRAKPPWKGIELSGEVESAYLYGTILEIYPYRLGPLKVCALPIEVDEGRMTLLSGGAVGRRGAPDLSRWIDGAAELWKDRKKESDAQDVEVHEYLDNHGNLTRQRVRRSVKLMYGGKGTHVRAAVIDTGAILGRLPDIPLRGFVFDMNMYYVDVAQPAEAHYLAAILNTPYVDEGIKETQTQGAFGARDIHRRPFEMFPVPEFDPQNPDHARLAEISVEAHARMEGEAAARSYESQVAPVLGLVGEASAIAERVCERVSPDA